MIRVGDVDGCEEAEARAGAQQGMEKANGDGQRALAGVAACVVDIEALCVGSSLLLLLMMTLLMSKRPWPDIAASSGRVCRGQNALCKPYPMPFVAPVQESQHFKNWQNLLN